MLELPVLGTSNKNTILWWGGGGMGPQHLTSKDNWKKKKNLKKKQKATKNVTLIDKYVVYQPPKAST